MRLVLLFEKLQNVHLLKDVGMVPYLLSKRLGYDPDFVSYRVDTDYPYLDAFLRGVRLIFIRRLRGLSRHISVYYWLWRNSRSIDLLVLIHISTTTIYSALIYKICNPSGYLYVKADMSGERIDYATWGVRNFLTQAKRVFLFSLFVKRVDLVSFECRRTFDGVKIVPDAKKIHVPNAIWRGLAEISGVFPRGFAAKNNRIILVARHGAYEKNSELMLDAMRLLPEQHLQGWEVCFAGTATEAFLDAFSRLASDRPALAGHVRLLGEIINKKELFELYSSSKIFVLPSRVGSESYPLVCCEALYFANALLITGGLTVSQEMTDNGQAGLLVNNNDAQDLANKLESLLINPLLLRRLSEHAHSYASSNLVWENIVDRLANKISQDMASRGN